MKKLLISILLIALALTGCDAVTETGDKDTDTEAAQSFIPTIAGYSERSTESVEDAVIAALGGASLLSGNVVQAGLINRLDTLLDCYRDVGALDSRIYTENLDNLNDVRIPIAGVLVVINQDRVQDNFLSCVSQSPLQGLRSQSIQPEPCFGSGSFTSEGDTLLYIYGATDTPLCDMFGTYFSSLQTS